MWWEGKTTQITRQNHKCLFSSKSRVVIHDFQKTGSRIKVDVDLVEELPARVGGRAAKMRDKLAQMGYTGVQAYQGSFAEWESRGGPVEK